MSVALRCDEDGPRGRYVVAMRKLQKGALLFQESPFSSVLAPEFYSSRCHHCYSALPLNPVPCLKCTQVSDSQELKGFFLILFSVAALSGTMGEKGSQKYL